ncbi:GerMN domain-containing protein [Paenibacillus nanensis]|nr:GerMN domain-containing protein [Paenibacillus nanensis]
MHKSGHSFQVWLASIILASALTGCGAQDNPSQSSGGGAVSPSPSSAAGTAGNGTSDETSSEAEKPAETVEIRVFGSDEELENIVERKVSVVKGTDLELVESALAELRKDGDGSISMWKGVHLLSTKLKDGIVTIDVHIPDEARLGAPGELQMVETLKSTLFQFSFVEGIEVLVAGEAVESMMGHVELEHPYVR